MFGVLVQSKPYFSWILVCFIVKYISWHVEYIGFDEFYTAVSNRKGYWIADTHEDSDKY